MRAQAEPGNETKSPFASRKLRRYFRGAKGDNKDK
jgi:hypothetical protein